MYKYIYMYMTIVCGQLSRWVVKLVSGRAEMQAQTYQGAEQKNRSLISVPPHASPALWVIRGRASHKVV